MIRFFRQIRQRLLSESRFSKYLLYAIGEVLLVVIGILIALQWKSSSKLPNNKLQVFSQIEYENLIDDHLYRLLRYENNLKKARGIIGEILLITGI